VLVVLVENIHESVSELANPQQPLRKHTKTTPHLQQKGYTAQQIDYG
jgi:hypothetical protein